MTADKTFITSNNISTFAKIQGASSFADRGNVILVWDDLSSSQKKLAKKIRMDDIEVRTSDPRSVPDKWQDNIVEEDRDPEAVDLIKQIIANPGRQDVYDMLKTYSPPEPLMLWWIDNTFTDPEYFRLLADACLYGLYQGDTKYLWAVMAFGVDSGVGKFNWPSSEKDDPQEKSIKKKVLEEYDIREKELEIAWEDIKGQVHEWVELDEGEADYLGVELPEDESNEGDLEGSASSLLDF